VVEYHDEKYDGSGYMHGISGEQIPVNARIFAIADVFDALTSKRPYKLPFPFEQTIQMMEKDAGTHFDPDIFRVFKKMAFDMYREISGAEEDQLMQMLDKLIIRHFFKKLDLQY